MTEYEFTVRLALPPGLVITDDLLERLGEGGCDDAIVGIGSAGRMALAFTRPARSARAAVLTAIRDVKDVIPGAELIEVSPDLVGMTDIADLVGRSRQNIRKLMLGPVAPAPAHQGSVTLWHLAPVLRWLGSAKGYRTNADLLELSEATMSINAAAQARRTDAETAAQVRALLG